ncbi:MAG TPA: tetratricopeptide repeat protein [Stellaceae bacterium]|jgi:tetratricopeptide (TPR) repeat protein
MSDIPASDSASTSPASRAALTVLRNALAAMNASETAPVGLLPVPEIMASAREIYASACTPANTMLIAQVVEQILHHPEHQKDPEIWAMCANVLCCDYLNRWNGSDAAQLAAAEHAAETALRLDPNHRRATYVAAFLHRARGRHAESLAAFERVIAFRPDAADRMTAEAYAQSGTQWTYLGHPERTRDLVDKAIAITPSDSPAIGVFYWINGRPEFIRSNYGAAIDWFERSIAIRRHFWYVRAWLIAAYELNKQRDEAQRALDEFRALFPKLDSVAAVINAERNIPHSNPVLIDARHRVHAALIMAGLPAAEPA